MPLPHPAIAAMQYIVRLHADPRDLREPETLGGKAKTLMDLRQQGLAIAPGFVIVPAAFTASLSARQSQAWAAALAQADLRGLQAIAAQVQPSEAVQLELLQILAETFPYGGSFAVRSSARSEDSAAHSFAGQLVSVLAVDAADLQAAIAVVWRSGLSDRLVRYRQQHGLDPRPEIPAVLVQQMLAPQTAGIAFAADPVTGRTDMVVVSATYGLSARLVSGEVEGDTFHIDGSDRIVQRQIVPKTQGDCFVPGTGRIESRAVQAALVEAPVLSDREVVAIAQLTRQVSQKLGGPQDIEWAICSGGTDFAKAQPTLYLLQARPLTTLRAAAPPASPPQGRYQLWDNSNIAESYSGVTTPLTFSFARRAYGQVYRQFCRLMGVPAAVIAQQQDTFDHTLGLLQGRFYYNLLNWYRMLALLPGFRTNRQFMEQMMGVKAALPEDLVAELARSSWSARWLDRWRLGRTVLGLLGNYLLLDWRRYRFQRRLQRSLALAGGRALTELTLEDLAAYYRRLEAQLLPHWDAPIVNDFFAMIFYGLLRRLTARWCEDKAGALAHGLLGGWSGAISAEPARRLQALAAIAGRDPQFAALLHHGSRSAIQAALPQVPEFHAAYRAYLAEFGDRCLEELKLESPTLVDDPLPLLRAIAVLAHHPPPEPSADDRRPALLQVRRALRRYPLRRWGLQWVLAQARQRLRDRENLRFERTRVFGRARQVFLECGRRLCAVDALTQAEDIFYLTVDELLSFVSGTAVSTDLKALTALRRAEFAAYRQQPALPDRFATYGPVYLGLRAAVGEPLNLDSANVRQGLGCGPGLARGVARAITDPKQALGLEGTLQLQAGTILVARHTDPGWILLFPAAAGLVIERGSVLSHVAIVARELGIPTVVGLAGAMTWIQDGDWLELDGSTGQVRKGVAPTPAPS